MHVQLRDCTIYTIWDSIIESKREKESLGTARCNKDVRRRFVRHMGSNVRFTRKRASFTFRLKRSPEGHLKRKSTCEKLVSAWFSAWTSQGLNLGPPEYESIALTSELQVQILVGAKVRIIV